MSLRMLVARGSLVGLAGWVALAFGCASVIGADDYKVAGGGTGTGATTGTGGPSAFEQQCIDFADFACASNTKCAVSTGDIQPSDAAAFASACKTAIVDGVPCASVKVIAGSVANCKADYQAESCTTFDPSNGLPPPPSCMGLFLK